MLSVRTTCGTLAALALVGICGCARLPESPRSEDNSPNRYGLEAMMDSGLGQKAPPDITRQLLVIEKDGLEDDRSHQLWADEDTLFAVVQIDLNDDGIPDYLVYPARYLPSLFGAHSISFWFFKGNEDGSYDLVLGGPRADEVEILTRKTNHFHDIDMIYHAGETETTNFKFDGHRYEEATHTRYTRRCRRTGSSVS